MNSSKRILAVIPARGGSKGLPGKNIRPLLGKPLIAWTIEQAKACSLIDELFVSTDSSEIAKTSEDYGVAVPFLRPAELASDTSSSIDVLLHVLDYLEAQRSFFDYVAMLEPTSPLRDEKDLEISIRQVLKTENVDGIISLGEVHTEHPWIVKRLTEDGRVAPFTSDGKIITQRQQCVPAFFPYGVIYMLKVNVLRREKTFYTKNVIPYFIERWQNYEIDDYCDFICVESILRERFQENM
jgi:CMP-N-acetylneuraminic acid synthetase